MNLLLKKFLLFIFSLFFVALLSLKTPSFADSIKQINPTATSSAITYSLSGGRFGDNVMAYLHAKWLAYKFNLPLIYQPFPYSDQLQIHTLEQNGELLSFDQTKVILNEAEIDPTAISTLFVVPYSPECKFEYNMLNLTSLPFIEVDWNDPVFKKNICQTISPNFPLKTILPSSSAITVGVHVRRGGGVDSEEQKLNFPLKFPPDRYYLDQIQTIYYLLGEKKLLVYLLTDDLHPSKIAKKYKQALNNLDIQFFYRKKGANSQEHLLADFFSIPHFDCLILCQSNFSLSASKLGSFQIKITPLSCKQVKGKMIIDEIEVLVEQ